MTPCAITQNLVLLRNEITRAEKCKDRQNKPSRPAHLRTIGTRWRNLTLLYAKHLQWVKRLQTEWNFPPSDIQRMYSLECALTLSQ